MAEKQLRRSMAVLPMSTVTTLTGLSARQVRYYEEQKLVYPKRNDGNRRLYSLNDVDTLLEVKDGLDSGMDFTTLRRVFNKRASDSTNLSDQHMRRLLEAEMQQQAGMRPQQPNLHRHI